jgi:DNA primase
VIDWVMKSEGVSFRHAVELLRENAPLSSAGTVKTSTVRRLPSPVDAEADDATILGQIATFYHGTLLASPDALAYLDNRGIRDDEAITRFQLGLADRSLGLRIRRRTASRARRSARVSRRWGSSATLATST